MQIMSAPPSSGKIAFQYALIIGGIAGAVGILFQLVVAGSGSISLGLGIGALVFFIDLAAYLVAGIFASKKTGKVATGTISGLLTGVGAGFLYYLGGIIAVYLITVPRIEASPFGVLTDAASISTGAAIAGAVGGGFLGVLFAVGLGAGAGAIGGLIGKNASGIQPAVAVMPVMMTYPGQPNTQYPPQQQYSSQQQYPSQSYPQMEQPNTGQQTPNPYMDPPR